MSSNTQFTCGKVEITHLVLGPIETNVYLVRNEAGAFVVDPADDCPVILAALEEAGVVALDAIVVTHAHFDHTGALAQLRQATGAQVMASVDDAPAIEHPDAHASRTLPPVEKCAVDRTLENNEIIELCGMKWQVLVTPGHTKGSICLYLPSAENGGEPGLLFSGDTLFRGAHGRTDFPGGSMSQMGESLGRLRLLPANTKVFPGHMQFTEIGIEARDVFLRIL